MNTWVYRVYLATGAGLTVVYAVADSPIAGVAYGLLGLAAVTAMSAGCRRYRPQFSRFWWLIFLALQVKVLGDVVLGVHYWVYPHSIMWQIIQNSL